MAGQLVSRGENTWCIRVFMGRDPGTGKRKYHNETYHGNKKDAQKQLNKLLSDRDSGKVIEQSKMIVGQYLDEWLETSVKPPHLRERTHKSYAQVVEAYIKPVIGNVPMDRLRPMDIKKLYSSLENRGLSVRTIRYTHAILSSALKQAVNMEMINRNPCTVCKLPKQVKREMQALSPSEASRFLEAARADRWEVLFLFAITTGCRPGEYLALQWKNVDLKAGTATIQRSVSKGKDGWQFTEPKTAMSRRTVSLPLSVVKALHDHRKRQAEERLAMGPEYINHDLVFASSHGTPLDARNLIAWHFKPTLKAAGLPDTIRLYDLRHTCATLLLSAGEHPKVASERLGHSTITLTMDTYSHVQPHMQRKTAEHLEAILFGQNEQEKEVGTL